MVNIADHERCVERLIGEIKDELFSPSSDLYSLLPSSAYHTAWVAMIPDPQHPKLPMFPGCLDWVLANQSPEKGFWGGTNATVQCLADTIACMVALKIWNVGNSNIERGLLFLRQNMEKLLMNAVTDEGTVIILPVMIELAQARGLEVLPADGFMEGMNDLFLQREHILGTMNQNSSSICGPYLGHEFYLEALPARYKTKQELMILREQLGGLRFRSPSAAACAFMTTGDDECLNYLTTVVQRCGGRGRFCWFVNDQDMLSHMKEKYNHYLGAMYEVYRASHLMFSEEDDLEKAKCFSRKIMQMALSCDNSKHRASTLNDLQSEIEHEMRLPWLDRMEHLEQRRYIEANNAYILLLGKSSTFRCRLSFPSNITELATTNFMLRQYIYRTELEELKRWSRETGLSNMEFGREKTTYCYFLAASAICLPLKSDLRIILAKNGILITVADDFFDEFGTLDELRCLTEAFQRWEGQGLFGHAKVIFDAVDQHVNDVTLKSLDWECGIKQYLQEIWQETFNSWLKESTWSRSRQAPTIKEYLDVGMVSVGIPAMIFPLCYLMCPKFQDYSIITRHNSITKLVMLSARLLNDIQSYQREFEEGKLNMVFLYLKENQEADVKSSIGYIKNILNNNQKVLLELLLNDDGILMPKEWKVIHLLILKVFHMLYGSHNAYDSPTALLDDISKGIHKPLEMEGPNSQAALSKKS